MSECPNCERQKQRVELWRQEAYRLSERQWVGLTDEMIGQMGLSNYVKVVRETEAKLKEKNT
jgi:hypothetical protein